MNEDQEPTTGCRCDGPGFCEYLGREMHPARWEECRTKPAFFAMFEKEAKAGKYKLPLWKRAKNFAGAVAAHIATGAEAAGEEELKRRLEICRGCDEYESESGDCGVCGCRLKIKASWAEQECPLGKW